MSCFNDIYKGKKVFITGHTGFKGSWMALWMKKMGAEVCGYSLASTTEVNHLDELSISIHSIIADIRDKEKLESEMKRFDPDIVFHMAAQPLVRYSYAEPSETYETNVMGTLNVLEACRKSKSVKAVICVTTDKVYENKESVVGYSENDRLGGYDPYSSSKACAEILTASYVNSFLNLDNFQKDHNTLIATVRGGNVIGGGDWSEDRLIPDIIRRVVSNDILEIRSQDSVRPWQHVLDCLSGYILLGEKLLDGQKEFGGSWNFGPIDNETIPVKEIVEAAQKVWSDLKVEFGEASLHETTMLKLKCDKAVNLLKWTPILNNDEMFALSFDWYKEFYDNQSVLSDRQLEDYLAKAESNNVIWSR